MVEIRFCKHNLESGSENIKEQLKVENHRVNISVESCIDYCNVCGDKPFALIDGAMVQADSIDELYEKLKEMI